MPAVSVPKLNVTPASKLVMLKSAFDILNVTIYSSVLPAGILNPLPVMLEMQELVLSVLSNFEESATAGLWSAAVVPLSAWFFGVVVAVTFKILLPVFFILYVKTILLGLLTPSLVPS